MSHEKEGQKAQLKIGIARGVASPYFLAACSKSPLAMRKIIALCIVSAFVTGPSAPAQGGAATVTAPQIALQYKTDPKAADSEYRDKVLAVSGTLQQISAGDNVTTAAVLLLATNPGLPLVRVEMAFPREGQTYEFHVIDGQRLEYRTRTKDFGGMALPSYVTGIRRSSRADPWKPLLQKGEQVSMVGLCKGRAVDVMMKDAALIKNGWNAGQNGNALIAGGNSSGSSGGPSYDPMAAQRSNEQANQRNQVAQQNREINQAASQREMQQHISNMNQATTARPYTPPAYTPPAYTPPAYTPPAYQPPPYRPPPGG